MLSLTTRVGSLLLLLGCTLDAGHGFATMERGKLSAELRPGVGRDLGANAVLTDLGYHVRLSRAEVRVARVELLELQGAAGGSGGVFDPADPPAGYTLCHGGHCHATDGRLVSYEEIQAMLVGGSATFVPVVGMPVERALDLLRGDDVPLAVFEPGAELRMATIARAEIQVERLVIVATVSEGDLADPVELEVDLALFEPLSQVLSTRVDRGGSERLQPMVRMIVGGSFFDGIDFVALAQDGAVAIEEGSASAALLTEALIASELRVDL